MIIVSLVLLFLLLFPSNSYCFSPEELLKTYELPKEFKEDLKEEIKKEEIKEKPKEEIKEHTPEQKEKEEDNFLDNILSFLFGDTKPYNAPQPTIPSTKEPIERNLDDFEVKAPQDKDLKKSIQNAINNSPDFKKVQLEAEIVKRQNSFTPVPVFSFGNDLATGKMLFSAGVQIPLDTLFTGKKKEEYAYLMIEKTKKEIEQRVIEQYKNISILQDKIQKKQEKIDHIKQFVLSVEEQYKNGIAKIEDLIKAKEILWQTETELETLKYELKTQIEKLNTIEAGGK